MNQYIGLYIIDEIVSINTIKLQLPTLMRIHLVVNIRLVVWYREQVGGQKVKEVKLVEVKEVEGDGKNIKQKKSKRSSKVLSTMEGVHSRAWHMGKRGELGKCERSSSWIWRKGKYRSKIIEKVKYDRKKRF